MEENNIWVLKKIIKLKILNIYFKVTKHRTPETIFIKHTK